MSRFCFFRKQTTVQNLLFLENEKERNSTYNKIIHFSENNNITNFQPIGCEILNKIAKQLLKMLNKCILFL